MSGSSVYIANLSASTTKESLDKFMAFCGSIQSIEMQEGQKAIVVFEKPSAASTALMLNGGTLDGSPIQVSSEELTDDHPSVAGDHGDHDDIPQESKPRTAIVAEYLAHGYVLSEPIINRAVAFDQKHGISSRFLEFFKNLTEQTKAKSAELDQQHQISEKAAGAYAQADAKTGATEKAKSAWGIGKSYYTRALQSQYGQQAQSFYTTTKNTLKDVHEEASRIAADKKHASAVANNTTVNEDATTSTIPAAVNTAGQPVAPTTVRMS